MARSLAQISTKSTGVVSRPHTKYELAGRADVRWIRYLEVDLGKNTFQLVALSAAGKMLLGKKFTQKQLVTFQHGTSLVWTEAVGTVRLTQNTKVSYAVHQGWLVGARLVGRNHSVQSHLM